MTTKAKTGVLATDAVETLNIKDANVTTAKLASNAVTAVKITDATITAAKMATGAISLPTAYIGGLRLSNDTDTDHDINITAGQSRDATDAKDLTLASEITKRIDASWAVGNDAGGLDTGSVATSTLYAVWLITRTDSGVVDALFSTSFTGPTMPTNYDYTRVIGAVKTDGSSNILNFTQMGNYFRYTGDVIEDVSDSSISTTFETGTLSAPPSSLAHCHLSVASTTAGSSGSELAYAWIRPVGAAEDATVIGEASQYFSGGISGDNFDTTSFNTDLSVLVDSSKQMQYAGTGASLKLTTFAFEMFTRSDPV